MLAVLEPVNVSLSASDAIVIAIGGGITSRGVSETDISENGMAGAFPLFSMLLPSFCQTASLGNRFEYRFYFAYDCNDVLFTNSTRQQIFERTFNETIASRSVTVVSCYV